MRSCTAVLLVLTLAFTGTAQAQQVPDEVFGVRLAVDPLPEPITPLYDVGATTVTLTVPCRTILAMEEPRVVNLTVEAPRWATVKLAPDALVMPDMCVPGLPVEANATVWVNTTADAPAFQPASLNVTGTYRLVTGEERTVVGATEFEAGYFALVGAFAQNPIPLQRPGVSNTFRVGVLSFGNGETRISFEVEDVTPGWRVDPPAPGTVGSQQTGGSKGPHVFRIGFTPPLHVPDGRSFGFITLRVVAESAESPAGLVDDMVVDVVIPVMSEGGVAGRATVPGPGAFAALAGAGVALALARVRRGATGRP